MKLRKLAILLATGATMGMLALGIYATATWFTLTDALDRQQKIDTAYDQAMRLSNAIDYAILLRQDSEMLSAIAADTRSLEARLRDIDDPGAREAIENLDEIAYIADAMTETGPATQGMLTTLASPMRVHQTAIMTALQALTAESHDRLIDTMTRALLVFFAGALTFAALSVAGFAAIQRRLYRPLANLDRTISALTEGNLDARADVRSSDELGELAEHLNRMAAQRQHDEMELRLSEQRFRQLTENIQEVFWLSNAENTRILYISPSYETVWGRSAETLYADANIWLDAIHPDDRPRVEEATKRQAQGDYHEIYRILRPDGEQRWISDRAFPVRDESGRVYRIAGLAADVTDPVAAYSALEQRMKELSCMYRVLELTTDDNKSEEDIYRQIAELVPASLQHEADVVARLTIGEERFDNENWKEPMSAISIAIEADGQAFGSIEVGYLTRHAETFLPEERSLIQSMATHIGQMISNRKMTQTLRRTERLEAVGQLTGGVAHDFNNLLTVIMGNGELLMEELKENADQYEMIEMIINAGQRGAELTHQLLAFARRQPLEPKAIDINDLAAGMESIVRRTLGEHIDIEFVRAAALWNAVADPAQLESALLNLAINARDAMSEGGRLTLETANTRLGNEYAAVQRGEVEPGPYVMLSISDTGSGMSANELQQVFEPFYTTKEAGQGTGLGLSMVYGYVKQLGGHINLYSEQGQGTTVKLYLPRAYQTDVVEEEKVEDVVISRGETILLVEDDEEVRRYASKQLVNLGYRVIDAADGPQALKQLEQHPNVDLLFTDVVMPGGMTGRNLADAATHYNPDIKVLFTSGYAENAIVHHGRLDPSLHFLAKPYGRSDLARSIRKALGSTS